MGSIHGYLFQVYKSEIKDLSSILIATFSFLLILAECKDFFLGGWVFFFTLLPLYQVL